MSDLAKWWLWHALHWALLYGAFAAEMQGAMYVVKFVVWSFVPFSLLLLADKAVADTAARPRRPLLNALKMLQAWSTLILLVWFGHIVTALAWAFVMFMVAVHRELVRRKRDSTAAVTA